MKLSPKSLSIYVGTLARKAIDWVRKAAAAFIHRSLVQSGRVDGCWNLAFLCTWIMIMIIDNDDNDNDKFIWKKIYKNINNKTLNRFPPTPVGFGNWK